MVNLIAGSRIVPELIQDNFTAAGVAGALGALLGDTQERMQMMADLAEVRKRLRPLQTTSSIVQVCDAVDVLVGNFAERGRISPVNV